MNKLVLDSNIIDYCYDLKLTKNFFEKLGLEIWVPTHVRNEIKKSGKEDLINKLNEIESSQTGFFGFSNNPNASGFGKKSHFFRKEYRMFIYDTAEKHLNDRYIMILAKISNAIFITADAKAFNDSMQNNINSIFISNSEKALKKVKENSENTYYHEKWTEEDFKNMLLRKIVK